MSNLFRFLILNAIVAAAAVTAPAQQPTCANLYTKWRNNSDGSFEQQKTAYETGKEFLVKCRSHEQLNSVADWVPEYEKGLQAILRNEFEESLKSHQWPRLLSTGKEILATEPENYDVMFKLVRAGVNTARPEPSGEPTVTAEGMRIARHLLQLVETGKLDTLTPKQLAELGEFKNKGEIVSSLNMSLGHMTVIGSPAEAAPFFIKAIQGEGEYKRTSGAYASLGHAYQAGDYVPLVERYQKRCTRKERTGECRKLLAKINLALDRVIDAYARALALQDDPGNKVWMKVDLENLYKSRHNGKTDGLAELVATVLSKPLPLK